MFSKSKRFEEKVSVGPSVGAYDVKLPLQGSTGPTTFDRSQRWGKQTESAPRGKENLNTTADESLIRATPQKELFFSARKPPASTSKIPAVLDRTSAGKLKEMELELCQLRQERMSLLREVGVAQEEAARVEHQLRSCRRDKVSLESGLASLQKEKMELGATVTKLEGMVAKMDSSKQASGKVHVEAANLRHQLKVVQSELVTVRQEWEAASRQAGEEKRAMEATIASLVEQVAAKEVDFVLFSARMKEEYDNRVKTLKESMDTARCEYEAKCKILEERLLSEREACEQQNDLNMQALQSMTAKCMEIEDELDHERRSYKQTQATSKAELVSTQSALKTMTAEKVSLRDVYRDLQRRLSASEMSNARLEAELEVVQHTAESKEEKAAQRLTQATATSEELRERLSLREEEVRVLQGQRWTLEQLVKAKDSEFERVLGEFERAEAKLVKDVALKDSEVEKMCATVEELTEQTKEKEERISCLLQQIQEKEMSSEKQVEVLSATEQRSEVCDEMLVLQLKDEIDVLRTEKTELSLNADKWKKEFHELQSRYSPYQDQIDQLVSRIQGLQSQSDLAESEAMRMGQQFAQLVGHTNHRQKIQYVQKLTNENLTLKKEVMQLREEEMRVKKKLRVLEDESSRLGMERKPLATRNC